MKHSSPSLDEILAKYDWTSAFTHPPNITSLLHHNVTPSSLQITQLKASLKGLKIPLAEIDGDLDLLRNAVMSLEAHRSRLQSLENDCATALSPIRRVPSEIMMEILRRSWKDNAFRSMVTGTRLTQAGFNVFNIREGPWHLGQVCSSWRNIIKTLCPELWASITIEIPSLYQPKARLTADTVEILRVVLERSRNHPLDFHFSYYGSVSRSQAEERSSQSMKQCFDLMIAHSRRWRVVEMEIHPSYVPQLSLVRGKVDLLRELYIDFTHKPPSGDIYAFEIAPKLEILHLKGMYEKANILFPTSNLVSFLDERPFAGDWLTPTYLAVVKSAPKLLSFSYHDYSDRSSNVHPVLDPLGPVMASSLEELSASSPSFLSSLVLPSLKEVTLTTAYEFDEEEQVITCPVGALGALHQMLLQSQCHSLTRLRLVDADLDDNLANIIRLVPRLREFTIEFYEWVPEIADNYGAIMQSLVAQLNKVDVVDGSPHHSVVPFLQSFTVDMHTIRYAHVSFINSAFVDMVASRVRRPHGIPHLTRLHLWVMGRGWSYALDEETERTLKSLQGEGLELDFCLDDGDPASEPDSDSD
ncbi:hypothetical protein IW261DRAFT_1595183 [Armillaria novae-zelandiae]|uniref:F-box domain-containing protein n=1 Tax=Armillaria novae-zelandiae TaxID=153914 RepID=A0AA39P250_9AGAR|nr:hypothetical protein IW261DRAFT_1595183 [Armillaria novae-zelandiae]